MSRSAKAEAALALHRFGMGPRPGSIAAIEADPRGALIAELDRPAISELAAANLPSSAKAYRAVTDAFAKRQAKAIVAKKEQDAKRQQMAEAPAMMEGAAQGTGDMAQKMPAEAVPDPGRPIYLEEARIRTAAAFAAEIGFVERLVWFWSNHFCVSADKIRSMSGAYEREAIRPHVLGRFTDLLLAAEGHPAMLFYLDQTVSMGANSTAGLNRSRGLNENLAREILELHTLGVRTGYTQDDVIGFANILTGWTLVPPGDNPEHGGEFTFNPRLHEPGGQTVLGKRYEQEDVEQGRAVLRDLAAHPATATHVATKLARHFVADEPPPALVERMAQAFLASDGDIAAVLREMFASSEFRASLGGKFKDPLHYVVSALRLALDERPLAETAPVIGALALLGEPLYARPTPDGYPLTRTDWSSPGQLATRFDVARAMAERVPYKLAIEGLGAATRETLAKAASVQEWNMLLLASPEFMQR
jgi:uncharacterized protein (DUF1800 family)